MWAGMYCLDLYCENVSPAAEYKSDETGFDLVDSLDHKWQEFPHQYTHELGSVCKARAREAGWQINKDGTDRCPKCTRREKEMEEQAKDKRKRKSSLTLIAEHLSTSPEELKD